jgi:hypothetical protein
VVWTGASLVPSRVIVRTTPVITAIRPACIVVAAVLPVTALRLFIAAAIVAIVAIMAIVVTLGEGRSCRRQRQRHDGGDNCFAVHRGLHLWLGGAIFASRTSPRALWRAVTGQFAG